jgi:hypothetical protein
MGAPRVQGELLKLGFEVAQSSAGEVHAQALWTAVPGMTQLSA